MGKGLMFLCACVVFMVWAGFCIAGGGSDHICFRRVDADQDGKVTFKEFTVHFGKDEKKFNAADQDRDGRLTHDEYHDYIGHGKADKNMN